MAADVERALTQAEATAVELVRLGRVEDAFKCVFGALREAFRPLVESVRKHEEMLRELAKRVREQGENIDRLARIVDKLTVDVRELGKNVDKLAESVGEQRRNIDKLTENVDKLTADVERLSEDVGKLTADVEELRKSLELEAHMRRSEVGAVRGEVVGLRVMRGLASWFRKHAPEYGVYDWPMRRGPDIIIEGRGILAAVEVTVRPKVEDVDQLITGAGIVKLEWGRKPDLLVVYSYSGEVPEEVAEYAAGRGVKIARGPRQVRNLLFFFKQKTAYEVEW